VATDIYTQDIEDEDPDPTDWGKIRGKLTLNERRVYLFLRWVAIRGGYPGTVGTVDLGKVGHYLGGKDATTHWEGGGAAISKAAVERAISGLAEKRLVSLDEG
jgi:hypothetical protein